MTAADGDPHALAAALTALAELLEPIVEATNGYRAKMEENGYSPAAAEMMAVEYHRVLIQMLVSNVGKK